ncbi:DUF4142 domain-containing protein [Luteimonas sp. S4-F44]|uniref:DUF4142 domain-containing protein n=1 Tax=Luteimonas sp. S4-F44 TaxID=2925842 RepID=UPI001F53A266|nr:DUF4142 domain-containing protein [Luteimonas sp. S4-F44]UNK41226.1 DUF4142 domain-containing protein [Luteimonas sp. S4-F44]
MNLRPTLLVASLAFALSACGERTDDHRPAATPETPSAAVPPAEGHVASGTVPADTMTPGAAQTGAAGALAPADRKALLAVIEVDRHEIAAAQDALKKGVGERARAYADQLRTDHERSMQATEALLDGTSGTAGASPQAADSDDPALAAERRQHDTERQRLDGLSGEAFEAAWIDAMVKGHQAALDKLDRELIPQASAADVRSHLERTRKTIAGHLEQAQALQKPAS